MTPYKSVVAFHNYDSDSYAKALDVVVTWNCPDEMV